ncbi:MAG: PE-PGRS family protein, partial [Chloroflexota bacterium]|nr:PE-PGRS family protein [Chloroflexota bacterium]
RDLGGGGLGGAGDTLLGDSGGVSGDTGASSDWGRGTELGDMTGGDLGREGTDTDDESGGSSQGGGLLDRLTGR